MKTVLNIDDYRTSPLATRRPIRLLGMARLGFSSLDEEYAYLIDNRVEAGECIHKVLQEYEQEVYFDFESVKKHSHTIPLHFALKEREAISQELGLSNRDALPPTRRKM